jgi:hypothetical protein
MRVRITYIRPLDSVQIRNNAASDGQSMLLVLSVVVRDTAGAAVEIGSSQRLRAHLLAGRSLHERGTAQENGSLLLDDNGLVRHGGYVCASRGTGSHDNGNLSSGCSSPPQSEKKNKNKNSDLQRLKIFNVRKVRRT